MEKLIKSLRWIDEHILTILVIGFAILIPLYPKLPLIGVNYTYVAVRVEDIYVAFVGAVFAIQFIRRKVALPRMWAILFSLFWISVFASYAYGYYVEKTVVVQKLGLLHALRRVEYMMIFFVIFSTLKTKKQFTMYMNVILAVLTIVSMYGIGQKFLGWPAVQTMNPEYAKGYWLVLDSWARISSTFAGHYDLAAYLIFLMPITIGWYLKTQQKMYFGVFLLSLSALILTASRASYIAYIVAVGMYLLYIRKWRLLLVVIVATALLTPLSDNLTQRLKRTFQPTKVFVDQETGQAMVAREIRPDDLPPGDYGKGAATNPLAKLIEKPAKVTAKDEAQAKKQIRESIIKEATKDGRIYTEEQIQKMVNDTFGRQIAVTKFLPDISLSTRFQVEWPRAIAAFLRNPILGTGPSSLTEATDGDYLRWLGETGLSGTILFLTIIGLIIRKLFYEARHVAKEDSYLFYGAMFGIAGLLINATYIDVFEASKVAYTFWFVTGLFIASLPLFIEEKKEERKPLSVKEKKHAKN